MESYDSGQERVEDVGERDSYSGGYVMRDVMASSEPRKSKSGLVELVLFIRESVLNALAGRVR